MSGMSIWEILLLGVGLSMDAFAVSICKGLSVKKVKWQHLLCVGAYFGIFQALMPTLGYFLGTTFSNLIDQFDHWVAFILLAIIGVNMVREALSKDEDETNDDFGFKTMLLLAIATLRLSYQVQHRAKKGKTLRALCVRMKLPHTN